jgi:hypothetical protein
MKNCDSFHIDIRPGLRRSDGGNRFWLVCHFSGGGLGSSESSQSTKVTNNQATLDSGGGAGSASIDIGGGNSGKNSGASVSITDDPQVVANALDSVDNAVTGAFTFGAETETIASQNLGQDNAVVADLAGQITGNGAEINPVTGASTASGFDWNTLVLPLTLLGGLATLLTFYRTKGTNT